MDKTSNSTSRWYLAFIAYELYIAAMSCVSTIMFLSLSFTAFYSTLFVEKRSDVLFCFICFCYFLRYLFRIDDDDSLKDKDQSNSSPLSTTNRPSLFYHDPPSPASPWRSKSSSPPVTTNSQPSPPSSSPAYSQLSQPVMTHSQPSSPSPSPVYSHPSPLVMTHSQPSSPSPSPTYSQPSPPATTNRPIPIYHEPRSSLSTPPRRSKQSSSSPTFSQLPSSPASSAPPRRSKRSSLSPAYSKQSPSVTTHSQPSSPSSSSEYSQQSPPVTTNRPVPIYHEPPSSTPHQRFKLSSSSSTFYQPPPSAPPQGSKWSSLSPRFYQPPYSPQFTPPSPESSYLPSSLSFLLPPPLPPFKMKDWKFIREGDYVRMDSEVSLSSDSDSSDINIRAARYIAKTKEQFRDE